MMKEQFSLYSEHIKGESNNVADTLSSDFSKNKYNLTQHLYSSFPKQMPKNFVIIDPPREIVSWILSVLEGKTALEVQRNKRHKKQSLISKNGVTSAKTRESKTNSCQIQATLKKLKYCVHSQQRFDGITLEKLQRKFCLEAPSEIPLDMFVRTSGLTATAIQELTSPGTQP